MKRILITLCCVLSLASVSFADERHSVNSTARVASFDATDPSFVNTYICDSSDVGCTFPEKLVTNNTILHFAFWSHLAQTYYRHYLVTDEGGTAEYYNVFSSSLAGATTHTFDLEVALPVGDYTFTAVVAGSDEGIIVSDQYRFSVR